jgi:uncharacterized protein
MQEAQKKTNKDDKIFNCRKCLTCCKTDGYVYVTDADISRIADFLKFENSFFKNNYCDIIRPRFALKSIKNGSCIFLNERGCIIYDVRPTQCEQFPHTWKTSNAHEYCKGLLEE